ncbi:MAG: CBS domain-containing protein [Chromatiales bacterium]|nr:CBS domain-containing protein [Chromatiales bacterium]
MRNQPIERIMTAPAWVIGPDATLEEAARLMARERLHHLPVVEGERLTGILSAGDLVGRDATDARGKRIGDVMQRDPVVLSRTSTLQDAATLLARGDHHSLPVVDTEGKVVGIVTSTDLIVVLLQQLPAGGPVGGSVPDMLVDLENVRAAAELYLRTGHGEHEHAALVRALAKAREHLGPGLTTGRL